MLRGLIIGIVWGGLLAVLVLGMASLIAPLPATVDPQTSAAPTTTGAIDESVAGQDDVSDPDDAVGEASAPAVETPSTENTPDADTASAPKPDPGGEAVPIAAPDASDEGAVAVAEDAPVDPVSPAAAPTAPAPGDDLSITTDPAQPAPPPVPDVAVFPDTDAMTAPATDNTDMTAPSSEADAPEIQSGTAPSADAATDMTPAAERDTPAPAPTESETVMKPAGSLKEKFPQMGSDRLPKVTGTDAEPEAADSTASTTPESTRPVDLFAMPFDNPDDKPLMAIVLLDDGNATTSVDALESFPYPLTFAVNSLAPDAKERAQFYRDKGFEVMAQVDIPAAAAPADVEVALTAHLAAVPNAVAVIEGTGDGLQGNRALSDQVTSVLESTGHGLLLFPQGLDTARKLATRAGVPAATVFRDFDSKGQNAVVIRRFLDQAAFRAASQEGGVVMVGRLRDETIQALLLWGLQDRATSVALAPVSAVLRGDGS